MKTAILILVAVLAASLAGCQGVRINPLPLRTKGDYPGHNCLSWRVANEAHNFINWDTYPPQCEEYLQDYVSNGQYDEDIKTVVDEAAYYVARVPVILDLRNIWIFDVDDTALSNRDQFFTNSSDYRHFLPAVTEVLDFYRNLSSSVLKLVFVTERLEEDRGFTEDNLRDAGYYPWYDLIMRDNYMVNKTVLEYKSTVRANLEKAGFRIIGNMGDQWSDIMGPSPGRRAFKLPNAFYYVR